MKPVDYKQFDERWGGIAYAAPGVDGGANLVWRRKCLEYYALLPTAPVGTECRI